MKNRRIEEITASIEEKTPLELLGLTERLRERFGIRSETPKKEMDDDAPDMIPYYTLFLVSIDCPREKKRKAFKLLRMVTYCSAMEAVRLLDPPEDGHPKKICTITGRHPSEARNILRPLVEELESLGAVLATDYDFGYFD